jgi:tetratricopeptide (TPR) repeat protein/tRNA A-37 threonylcarbamoyl transferase component Bud32
MGGMGEVYLCYDHKDHVPYAIKTFQDKFLMDQHACDRFTQEALTWVRLEKHRNIVQCHHVENIAGKPYIFMEHVVGPEGYDADLRSWLRRGRLDVEQALHFAIQICLGMQHAQRKVPGLVHRDIKPENILITRDMTAKVTDFGLVKIFEASGEDIVPDLGTQQAVTERASVRRVGTVVGTPPYMSPEQCRGEAVDVRSDIYSFGCMFYEMLSGRLAFEAKNMSDFLRCHIEERAARPSQYVPSLPTEVEDIVMRCLAKGVEERYRSFGHLLETLAAVYEELTGGKPDLEISDTVLEAWELSNKAASLGNLNRHQEAVSCCDQAVEIDRSCAAAWCNKGSALQSLGQHQEAIVCCDEALEIDFRHADAWCNKGNALHDLRRHEEAIACFDRALEIDPKHAIAWYDKGNTLSAQGRHREAIACYDEALKIDPRYAKAGYSKANALYALRQYREAVACFDSVLEIDARNPDAWHNKGAALSALGDKVGAIACYDRALQIDPRSAEAWSNKGSALNDLGQRESALACYDEALRVDPRYSVALYNKGNLLCALRRYQEAVVCYDGALEIDPNYAEAWSNKGAALCALGEHEEAVCCYDHALQIDTTYVDAWFNKGVALAKSGRFREAVPCFERALQLGKQEAAEAIAISRRSY